MIKIELCNPEPGPFLYFFVQIFKITKICNFINLTLRKK